MTATDLVEIDDLHVGFGVRRPGARRRVLHAVDGVSLRIGRGSTLGLVGESGSGKSTLGRAVLRLVPVDRGRVLVDGTDVTALRGRALRRARRTMQMVFQDPYSSLDPSSVVGDSIAEPLREHERLSRRAAEARARELLDVVGLPAGHADRYPYEFSGGQRQRIAIARAVASNPSLVVCDEAVSALDVSTQNQVINLLEELRERFALSYLFIAHDLAVVRHIAQTVAVMYLGHVVESGPTGRVYERPAHPYTRALLSAIPASHPRRAGAGTRTLLSGDLPDPADPPAGCPFVTRCPVATDVCREVPPVTTPVDGGGEVACHLYPAAAGTGAP